MSEDDEDEALIASKLLLNKMEAEGIGIISNGEQTFIAMKVDLMRDLIEQAEANDVDDVIITIKGSTRVSNAKHNN